MEHELPPLASHACKVQRLCSSRGRSGSQRSINVPQCQEGLFPSYAGGGSWRCQGLHACMWGWGCSARSTYLTRDRACQQVKTSTPALSLTLAPYCSFFLALLVYLRSKVHLFMGDIPRTRSPAQAMATRVSWAVAILLGRQTKDPAAATAGSPWPTHRPCGPSTHGTTLSTPEDSGSQARPRISH